MSSDAIELSIITVNYRVPALLTQLLRSVPEASGSLSWEVIVVDNASGDDSVEMLRRDFPHVRTIASPTNLGFSRGNNLGVSEARGRWLALVNPDVVLPPLSMSRLVAFLAERPRIGLVGPRITLPDGKTQSSPRALPSALDLLRVIPGAAHAIRLRSGARGGQATVRCGVVHGACMLFRREAYAAAGGLPDHVFMYGEEAIIGHRIDAAGFETWYHPAVEVLHQDEASADQRWQPRQKELRKRNGHITAHVEIFPRPLSVAWNAMMAARELSRAARWLPSSRELSGRHFDLARLHLAGIGRVKGDPANPLSD